MNASKQGQREEQTVEFGFPSFVVDPFHSTVFIPQSMARQLENGVTCLANRCGFLISRYNHARAQAQWRLAWVRKGRALWPPP